MDDPTKPIQKKANVTYKGRVERNYTYMEYCDEEEICAGHPESSTTSAAFNNGIHEVQINTYVYNGKKDLKKKEYENKISNNYDKDFKAKILWTNSPIKFDVIRYMFHLDAAGNPKTWEAVPGRYQREFVQQCSADIDWNVTSSMKTGVRTSPGSGTPRKTRPGVL
ncbi:hypothetical protein JCM15579A_01340 [Marinifilum fragile]